MMRATLILIGLGILVAMEFATPPRTKTASTEPLLPRLTAKISDSRDTLVNTDRLEIPYAPYEARTQAISFIERTPLASSPAIIPEEIAKIVDQRGRGTSVRKAAVCKTGSLKGGYGAQVLSGKCLQRPAQGVELVGRMRNVAKY
jgi:hypothetical protein